MAANLLSLMPTLPPIVHPAATFSVLTPLTECSTDAPFLSVSSVLAKEDLPLE